MIMTNKSFFLIAVVVLLFAFATSAFARSVDPKLVRAIRKANSEWAAAMKTGDAAAIAAPYADDAVFVLVDGTCIQGRARIEAMYRAGFERAGFATSTRIDSKKLVVDGDLAYESGYGEVGTTKAGKLSTRGGRYLTVWQRQAGGDWKIIRNIVFT
ncbi:MAG TPA: SgcJ/EcaC family oxidoreductase [Pyrinomonadaceae bacterium]|nr:SgcJ/EcaC family oxidoreductase [Pyrinomonadaceae bacterium]